jgi:hypothetical protein
MGAFLHRPLQVGHMMMIVIVVMMVMIVMKVMIVMMAVMMVMVVMKKVIMMVVMMVMMMMRRRSGQGKAIMFYAQCRVTAWSLCRGLICMDYDFYMSYYDSYDSCI